MTLFSPAPHWLDRLIALGRRAWAWTRALVSPPGTSARPQVNVMPEAEVDSAQSRRDRWRQVLNVVLAAAQTITPAVAFYVGLGQSIESVSNRFTTPITPADGAFAIWSLIYPGCLAYAVYQALPGQRTNPLFRQIGPLTALAFLANAVWPLVFGQVWLWPSVLVIAVTLLALLGVVRRIARAGTLNRSVQWLVILPLSLFAGWITAATVLNTTIALKAAGLGGPSPSPLWSTGILLVTAGLGSTAILNTRGNLPYALALAWAFGGIALNAASGPVSPNPAVVATGSALSAVMLGSWLLARRNPPNDEPGVPIKMAA